MAIRKTGGLDRFEARDAMAATALAAMETAACCIIQIIKDTPDLRNTKVAIAGDMAIRKYLPEYGQLNAEVSHFRRKRVWTHPDKIPEKH